MSILQKVIADTKTDARHALELIVGSVALKEPKVLAAAINVYSRILGNLDLAIGEIPLLLVSQEWINNFRWLATRATELVEECKRVSQIPWPDAVPDLGTLSSSALALYTRVPDAWYFQNVEDNPNVVK
jgi:hypothetical protein